MKTFTHTAIAALAQAMVAAATPTQAQEAAAALPTWISGTPVGFAAGATGAGNTAPTFVAPGDITTLKALLTSKNPETIIISGTYDFRGSEGTSNFPACDPYTCPPASGGQSLLNTLGGCGTLPLHTVTLDTAGMEGINVQSDKTLIGLGAKGATLVGKGLRMVGVSNIIIQNIAITNLNPQYVWGGDAFVLSSTNLIWIDHVTTSLTGRQHYSFGEDGDNAVTISNSFINGVTTQSATCDGHTYWGLELVGSGDTITFYKNYVHNTSGRSPALSGNTLFHAVNSVWDNNSGHAIEGTSDGMGVFEGCVFNNVPTVVVSDFVGQLFSSENADVGQCVANLKRNCVPNLMINSQAFNFDQTGFFADFNGRPIAPAASASSIQSTVPAQAGNTIAN